MSAGEQLFILIAGTVLFFAIVITFLWIMFGEYGDWSE